MDTQKLTCKLLNTERETHLYLEMDVDKWVMDSTIPKDFNRALKQGWAAVSQTIDSDGHICGMILQAPRKAVTIRNAAGKKPQTPEQRERARKAMETLNSNRG